MKRTLRPVFLLHPDRLFQERVKRACEGRYELQEVADWGRLLDRVRRAPPSALVVVDPYEAQLGSEQLSARLRALLREFPSLTVLAACALRRGSYEDARVLGEWGVTRIITLDEEDTSTAIAHRLASAQGRPLRSLLQRALPTNTPGTARALLIAAADTVSLGGTAGDLARTLHVTPRTLQRWCQRASLPAPRQLLAWMRILLAAELLDDPGRSALGVALASGYSSDAALRNVMRRYLGRTPLHLRADGAFQIASGAFLDALRRTRLRLRATTVPAETKDVKRPPNRIDREGRESGLERTTG